jgi:hypothetical protein
MSERYDHGENSIGKIRIQLFTKSFILQVYDVLARHTWQRDFHEDDLTKRCPGSSPDTFQEYSFA